MTLGDLLNSAVLRAGAKRGDVVGNNRQSTNRASGAVQIRACHSIIYSWWQVLVRWFTV